MTDDQYAPDVIPVEALMNVPGDEAGRRDRDLTRCDCGELVPVGDDTHGTVCEEWDA